MNFILIIFALGFLAALAAGAWFGRIPDWVATGYVAASLVAFVAYAWDKHRARRGRGRTAEKTLHLFELLGGWPGALIAQRLFRHKNRKFTYQRTFWLIVSLHLAGWIFLWYRSTFG